MKQLLFIVILIGLFSCTNNRKDKNLKKEESKEIIWIRSSDSLTNFEVLLSTRYLYYLSHMSVNYYDYDKSFWKSIDTLKNDSRTLTTIRKGLCKTEVTENYTSESCLEHKEFTLDKTINKVVRFKGSGSGYFATVDYVYDQSGNLMEYKHRDKECYLKYDKNNQLNEVLITEVKNGNRIETGLIKFN